MNDTLNQSPKYIKKYKSKFLKSLEYELNKIAKINKNKKRNERKKDWNEWLNKWTNEWMEFINIKWDLFKRSTTKMIKSL